MNASGTVRTWQVLALIEGVGIVVLLGLLLGGEAREAARSGESPPDAEAKASPRPGALDDESAAERPIDAGTVERGEAPQPGREGQPRLDDIGAHLHGRVTDREGDPLGARIWLTSENEDGRGARCNEEGIYVLPALRPGTYRCRAHLRGYVSEEVEVEIPEDRSLVRQDFTLASAHLIKVRIESRDGREISSVLDEDRRYRILQSLAVMATPEPAGEGLPKIEVSSYAVGPHSLWAHREASSSTVRSLDERWTGVLELLTPAPIHAHLAYRHLVLDSQLVQPDQTEMTFRVDPQRLYGMLGTVAVRVLDGESGGPLTTARVSVSTTQAGAGRKIVGADGRIEIECQPGIMEVEISAPDHDLAHRWVDVPAGGRADLGTVTLHAGTHVAGRVVGPRGEPIEGASVGAMCLVPGSPRRDPPRYYVRTDGDGRFETGFYVERGPHLLFVAKDGHGMQSLPVDTTQGSVEGLLVRLGEGTPVIFDGTSAGDRLHRCWLEDAQGRMLRRSFRSGRTHEFHLAPGEYRLLVTRGDETVKRLDFTVGEEPKRVKIDMP